MLRLSPAYISSDSPTYTKTVVKKIVKMARQLERFPNSGREVPEFQDPTVRELFAYSYRIIYKVERKWSLLPASFTANET
jgi:toxin ParE1/3/4